MLQHCTEGLFYYIIQNKQQYMVSVEKLTVRFGGFTLLDELSFLINDRDRIGLVGKNGAGKSTLMKILAGMDEPSSGQITRPRALTTGYLSQHFTQSDNSTVIDEVMLAFDEVIQLQQQIENINHQIGEFHDYNSTEYFDLIDKLTHMTERYEILGGNNCRGEAERALLGLGFLRTDFDRPTSVFSGGWRMRIELARLLLQKPGLLLLDEPTNHLDIESIQWLETFLSSYPGAVILVSHDRAFLDGVTNRTIEIVLGKIYDYKASYSKFVELRKERRDQQQKTYENQQKMIKDTEDFIERFRYKATKAVQVQSRIKQLDKVVRIEIDDEENATLAIRFNAAPRSGEIVAETEDLAVGYDGPDIISDVTICIERGEKVAFVGKNGAGKSTLVKTLMGHLKPKGKYKQGHNVIPAYFAQTQADSLDGNITVLDTVDRVAKGDIRTKIRDMLGAFLFSGEDVEKKVSVLSGGERTRLAMVLLLLEPANLLVLDEPTNHLDMRSKEVLKQAILNFEGTAIIVSHDRDFLDGLVSKVYEFGGGTVKEHLGGIYEFLERKKVDSLRELERKEIVTSESGLGKTEPAGKAGFEARKEMARQQKKLERDIEKAEAEIMRIEAEITKEEVLMSKPENASDTAIFKRYNNLKKDLETAMQKWEEAHAALETFMAVNN